MSTDVTLRGLRADDVPGLEAALAPVLDATYPGGARWLRTRLTAPAGGDVEVTVADHAGALAGLLVAQRKPRGVKLSCLWVAPHARARGVGRALLGRAVAAFGSRPVYITFDRTLSAALVPLLHTAGFTATATLPGRYAPDAVEVVYTRAPDPLPPVRALSLTRPWGQLLLHGGKNVENRSRRTGHRGLLVLHGARSTTNLAVEFTHARQLPAPPADPGACATGYLGVAHLVSVDCHHDSCGSRCSPWAMPDSWHWRVVFATAFDEPIPGRGNVSLWTPPPPVLDAVAGVLAAGR